MTKVKVVSRGSCWCFAPLPTEKPKKKESEVKNG